MQINELFLMKNPHDHIMANTWRLIFERGANSALTSNKGQRFIAARKIAARISTHWLCYSQQ